MIKSDAEVKQIRQEQRRIVESISYFWPRLNNDKLYYQVKWHT